MKELEIEIKAYCREIAVVKQKLDEFGAVYIKTQMESDIYYNHPVKNFGETDEALRLRSIGSTTILTYKGPKVSMKSKARVEKEVVVHGDRETGEILLLLGFRESGSVVKKRNYYKLNNITVCLDEVEGLGVFVELEQKGDDIDLVEKDLYRLADRLGLERFERRSYLELLLCLNS